MRERKRGRERERVPPWIGLGFVLTADLSPTKSSICGRFMFHAAQSWNVISRL